MSDRYETDMAPNSPVAILLGISTCLLIIAGFAGFAFDEGPRSTENTLQALALLGFPITGLIAAVVQSRWKTRYREATGTWTDWEFTKRVIKLSWSSDYDAIVELYSAPSVAAKPRRRRDILIAVTPPSGKHMTEAAVELAIGAVGDDDARVRAAACDALGRSRGAEAADVLVAALDDPDDRVQTAAARGLGMRRERAAVPQLQAMLAETDAGVQAAFALAEIGDHRSLPAIELAAAASRSGWHAKQFREAAGRLAAG